MIAVDETLERRKGKKIKAKGVYRDAVRSSQTHVVTSFGLKWESMMLQDHKSEMRIYENGNIYFNNRMYCTHPSVTHYDEHISLDDAPLMIIKGEKFKIFEIPYDPNNIPLEGYVGQNDWSGLERGKWLKNEPNLSINSTLYIGINLKDFKWSENDLIDMSNEEIAYYFRKNYTDSFLKPDTRLQYETEKSTILDHAEYEGLGQIHSEKIGKEYYQRTTEPVRVVSAPKMGSTKHLSSETIQPNDFLIKRSTSQGEKLAYLSRKNDGPFEAFLCDSEGKVVSDKAFKPGEKLPSPDTVWRFFSSPTKASETPAEKDNSHEYHR